MSCWHGPIQPTTVGTKSTNSPQHSNPKSFPLTLLAATFVLLARVLDYFLHLHRWPIPSPHLHMMTTTYLIRLIMLQRLSMSSFSSSHACLRSRWTMSVCVFVSPSIPPLLFIVCLNTSIILIPLGGPPKGSRCPKEEWIRLIYFFHKLTAIKIPLRLVTCSQLLWIKSKATHL
jgi:hypothetical protein